MLELHARSDRLYRPDPLVIALDPDHTIPFSMVADPARRVGSRLEELDGGVYPSAFGLRTVPDRLRRLRAHPWRDYSKVRESLTRTVRSGLGLE